MTDKKELMRQERDKKLMKLIERGLTNEEIGREFGCCTRAAGCHRTRLLSGGKVPQPGYRRQDGSAVQRDSGDYMAFVTEHKVAPPEEAVIRVVHVRPLPTAAISYARIGSAGALCAALGERRAA